MRQSLPAFCMCAGGANRRRFEARVHIAGLLCNADKALLVPQPAACLHKQTLNAECLCKHTFRVCQSMCAVALGGTVTCTLTVMQPLPPPRPICRCTLEAQCAAHRNGLDNILFLTQPGCTQILSRAARLPCEHCTKQFHTASSRNRHRRETHGRLVCMRRPHKCMPCGKRFIQLVHLKKHITSRTHISRSGGR